MNAPLGLFLDGALRPSESGSTYDKVNPSRPEEIVTTAADATATDMHEALDLAVAARAGWAATALEQRAATVENMADRLEVRRERVAADIVAEVGRTVRDAAAEVERAVASLRATAAARSEFTVRRPVGVVGLVSPWNLPIASAAWKVGPALLAGNTVVLKPASESPRSAMHLAECAAEAALPPGVLGVLTGVGGAVGGLMISDDRVDAVSWTGSDVGIGNRVRDESTSHGKRVHVVLGGLNSLVVTAEADLDLAVSCAVIGAFSNAGQLRTATRRVFVHDAIAAEFRVLLLARVGALVVGDAADPATDVGPIVNAQELETLASGVRSLLESGDRLISGGDRLDGSPYLFAPTVLDAGDVRGLPSDVELFGPIVTMFEYTELEDAIARANSGPRVMSASIITPDSEVAAAFAAASSAPVVHVNGPTVGVALPMPLDVLSQGYTVYDHWRTA